MCVEIAWYGERGIINSLVLTLKSAGVGAVREMLRAVQWAGERGHPPDWINRVQAVKFLVEIGASQFGDPDLIIICKTDESHPYVVFVEAKICGYVESAMSIHGGIRENFNSSINGQLSLKYRLSQAMNLWSGGMSVLSEPRALADAYQQAPSDGGLGDPSRYPRRLAKPGVLQLLRDNGLGKLPLQRFHYVALTRDSQPVFSPGFEASEFRPLFLDEQGMEIWAEVRARVGWLGFSAISDLPNLAGDLGDEYRRAVATMIPNAWPHELVEAQQQEFPELRTYRIEEHANQRTIETLDAIEGVGRGRFGQEAVERWPGSTSITLLGRVLVKLVPRKPGPEEYLLLGIAASLGRRTWGEWQLDGSNRIGIGPNAQKFYTIQLPRETAQAMEIADGIFDILAEMLEVDREHPEV